MIKKIEGNLLGRDSAAMRRDLGGTNLGLRQSYSAGDTSLLEREIIVIISTNNYPILGSAISMNIFNITISSQTLVHLLYPILVSKSGIGASGLLVVLITPCS